MTNLKEFLIATAIASMGIMIGSAPGLTYVIGTMIGGIGTNIQSSYIQRLFFSDKGGIHNHDIQRAWAMAYKKTLQTLEDKYLIKISGPEAHSRRKKESIENFFLEFDKHLQNLSFEDIARFTNKQDFKDNYIFQTSEKITKNIQKIIPQDLTDDQREFIKFLFENDNFFEEIQASFHEVLKTDDAARNAFLISFTESIKKDTGDIKEIVVDSRDVLKKHIESEAEIIPTIQTVLNKEGVNKGDFFKKEPDWIDFEQEFVIERGEVNDIIKRLETEKVQSVIGMSAAGKSIILKNVGFKLTKNRKVYIIELKKYTQDDIKHLFDNIPRINDNNAVFIVDDAHLYVSECEKLIKNFKSHGIGKLIIGSRETEEIKGYPKETSQFEYLKKICVQAKDVTEEIIKSFLKEKYHFNDERIMFISQNLERYKKDLWFLSWALKSYNPNKDSIEEEEIYENIRDSIRKIKIGEDIINAEDILLPLSIFYRFEIPIERKFLEKQLNIEEDKIDQLIKLTEIKQMEPIGKKRTLYLHHSSIAELYFGAFQRYPDLGEEIKDNIIGDRDDDEKLEYCMFYRYLTAIKPRNVIDVMSCGFSPVLLTKLAKDNKIKKAIETGINIEEDIEKIAHCMTNISWGYYLSNAKPIELQLDISSLSTKIEKENEFRKIFMLITAVGRMNVEVGLKLIEKFQSRIEKESVLDDNDIKMWKYLFIHDY